MPTAFCRLLCKRLRPPVPFALQAFDSGRDVAVLACGLTGLVTWWLVSRLRSRYFAIATWVVAATSEQIVSRFSSLGGGTSASLLA
jgi:ABC-type branched-subunit amino acid transport system permease subunit